MPVKYFMARSPRKGACSMGDLERYIVEEWAEDYQDGRLNRREFLRRVALMAGGTAVALPVLRQLGVGATLEEISAATSQAPVVVAQAAGVTRSEERRV